MRVPIRLNARSKYGAKRTNGYASGREAKRAQELLVAEKCGTIFDLKQQVSFDLLPPMPRINCWKPLRYIADFVYSDANGRQIVEDVKGFKTPEYRLKKRLMLFIHGIVVQEV